MANIRKHAGPAGAKAPALARKLKRYRVLYAVTRAEWYEIGAPDEDTARRDAFCEGELVEQGDTTDVTPCYAEEVCS